MQYLGFSIFSLSLAQPYALASKASQKRSHPQSKLPRTPRLPTFTMPQAQPELKKVLTHPANLHSLALANTIDLQYLDKRLFVQLNGSRRVIGVLRGYDVCLSHLPSSAPSPFTVHLSWDPAVLTFRALAGLSQHRPRRSGRREGWRGKSEDRDGGMSPVYTYASAGWRHVFGKRFWLIVGG